LQREVEVEQFLEKSPAVVLLSLKAIDSLPIIIAA